MLAELELELGLLCDVAQAISRNAHFNTSHDKAAALRAKPPRRAYALHGMYRVSAGLRGLRRY
jgi:hypothetical protein